MSFEQYWDKVLRSNPTIERALSINLSPEEFKLRLRRAYEAGVNHANEVHRAAEEFAKVRGPIEMPDFFKDLGL
jgi:hypothetical protein